MIQGPFSPDPKLDSYQNKFIYFLSGRPQLPRIPEDVTSENFSKNWRKSRESSYSYMSNRHFGNYRAAYQCILLKEVKLFFLIIIFLTV